MNGTLRGFLRKELLQTLRDKRMRLVLFVMPVIQMTLFGLAISTEIRGIRLKVVRSPGDRMAQRVEEKCLASGWFVPARTRGEDAFEWIRGGSTDAVLVAPPGGLTREFVRGSGRLQFLVEATDSVRARGIESYMRSIVAEAAREQSAGAAALPPVALDVRVLYNPSMESAVFMVPGVMSMVLAVLTIILTAMSMAREKEIGTFEMLISAPVREREILLGKTLPYVFLGMLDFPLIAGVGIFLFGVPLRGQCWQMGLSALLFVCTTVSVGTLISTFARNQQQAMMGGFLFLFPAMLLSGILYPLDNMPDALKIFAYLNPLKYFVTLLRSIMLKGWHPQVFYWNLAGLALLCALSAAATYKRFRPTLN